MRPYGNEVARKQGGNRDVCRARFTCARGQRELIKMMYSGFVARTVQGFHELVRLMNQEGLHSTSRLDYIMTSFTLPALTTVWQGLNRLADAGVVRRVPARTLLFLIAHGAAAPFTLGPLSDRFDPVDGPLDPVDHIELATDIIVSGLRIAQPDGAGSSNEKARLAYLSSWKRNRDRVRATDQSLRKARSRFSTRSPRCSTIQWPTPSTNSTSTLDPGEAGSA